MGRLFHDLHVPKFVASGTAAVTEISHVISPYIHAVEQPVMNAAHETETVVQMHTRLTHGLYTAGVYGVGFWLGWGLFGQVFPRPKRLIKEEINGVLKRMRL